MAWDKLQDLHDSEAVLLCGAVYSEIYYSCYERVSVMDTLHSIGEYPSEISVALVSRVTHEENQDSLRSIIGVHDDPNYWYHESDVFPDYGVTSVFFKEYYYGAGTGSSDQINIFQAIGRERSDFATLPDLAHSIHGYYRDFYDVCDRLYLVFFDTFGGSSLTQDVEYAEGVYDYDTYSGTGHPAWTTERATAWGDLPEDTPAVHERVGKWGEGSRTPQTGPMVDDLFYAEVWYSNYVDITMDLSDVNVTASDALGNEIKPSSVLICIAFSRIDGVSTEPDYVDVVPLEVKITPSDGGSWTSLGTTTISNPAVLSDTYYTTVYFTDTNSDNWTPNAILRIEFTEDKDADTAAWLAPIDSDVVTYSNYQQTVTIDQTAAFVKYGFTYLS